jgi:hypothetical protein
MKPTTLEALRLLLPLAEAHAAQLRAIASLAVEIAEPDACTAACDRADAATHAVTQARRALAAA